MQAAYTKALGSATMTEQFLANGDKMYRLRGLQVDVAPLDNPRDFRPHADLKNFVAGKDLGPVQLTAYENNLIPEGIGFWAHDPRDPQACLQGWITADGDLVKASYASETIEGKT